MFCSSLCYGAYDFTYSPLKSESSKRAKEMAAPMMEGKAATITIHLKLLTLFKDRNPELKERAPQMCESQWKFIFHTCGMGFCACVTFSWK